MQKALKELDKWYKGIDVSKLGKVTKQEIHDRYGPDVVEATSRYFIKYPPEE